MNKLNFILLILCLVVELFNFISNWIIYRRLVKFEKKFDMEKALEKTEQIINKHLKAKKMQKKAEEKFIDTIGF